jgi:hypothetical protein
LVSGRVSRARTELCYRQGIVLSGEGRAGAFLREHARLGLDSRFSNGKTVHLRLGRHEGHGAKRLDRVLSVVLVRREQRRRDKFNEHNWAASSDLRGRVTQGGLKTGCTRTGHGTLRAFLGNNVRALHLVESLATASSANVQVVKLSGQDCAKAFDGGAVGALWLQRNGGSSIAKVTVVNAFVIHLENRFFIGQAIR